MGKTAKKRKEKRGRELAQELEKHTEHKKINEEISKLQDNELFEITDKSKDIKKIRGPLDPLRFKKKAWKFLGKSKNEARMVKQLARKIEAGVIKTNPEPKKSENEEMMDLWDTDIKMPKKPMQHAKKSMLPAIPLPHAGQSYNPAAADYKDLLKRAVEFEKKKEEQDKKALEILKPKVTVSEEKPEETKNQPETEKIEPEKQDFKISSNKPVDDSNRKSTAKKNREKRVREQMRKEELLKEEKRKLNDINRLKELIKQVKGESEEVRKKREEKQKRENEILEKQKEGVEFGYKKLGRYKYFPMQPHFYQFFNKKYEQHAVDFMLPEELPKRFNEIKTDEGSNIRNFPFL